MTIGPDAVLQGQCSVEWGEAALSASPAGVAPEACEFQTRCR